MSTISSDRASTIAQLLGEVRRPDLAVYTVCVLAQRDLERGDLEAAIARLRVDADKLRMYETPINTILAAC